MIYNKLEVKFMKQEPAISKIRKAQITFKNKFYVKMASLVETICFFVLKFFNRIINGVI